MVLFVVAFYPVEDGDGLLHIGRLYKDFLESAVKGAVLFYDFAEFVRCGRPDALQVAPRKRRLQHVCGVQVASCASGPYYCMEFVYEKDYVGVAAYFIYYGLEPFLEVTPVLCPCDD